MRRFVDAGSLITADDVLRPRDRGFLASVLAPDTRAISIKVDAESGVSGLIWPGDNVDVVLTQMSDKADAAHRSLSEVVLHNVRIIAIDQDIVQGAKDNKDNSAAAAKDIRSVSLQLLPEQVKTIAIAKELGLSLAIRAAVEHEQTRDAARCSAQRVARDRPPERDRQRERDGRGLWRRQAEGILGQEARSGGHGAFVWLRSVGGRRSPRRRLGEPMRAGRQGQGHAQSIRRGNSDEPRTVFD